LIPAGRQEDRQTDRKTDSKTDGEKDGLDETDTAIPRLTSDPAEEFFG